MSDSSFTINYPQAKDDHNEINFYEIKLVEKETGKTVANTPFITSSYYWTKGGEDQVDINTWDFTDLTSNTTYTVEIIPYNVYYKTGNPIQCEVKTEASIESQFKTVYDLNPDTAAIISGSTENLDTDAHGMTVDKTNTIWTPKVNASNTSMNQKVLSFTTRTGKTGSLFKLDFTKDTAISHDAFTKGHYLFTTQVGLLHKSTGNISLTLFGKDSSGSEKQVMKAVFNGQSGTDASKGYLVNNSGTRIGSMVSVEMGNKNDSWVSGYTTLKADINLEENTISAWIGSTKVVDNQPLDVTGITEITAFDCSISGDTATYGALFQYIRLGEPIGTAEDAFTAKISANTEDLLSGNAADVTVSFDNPAEETHTATLYIAAYDADGNLLTITKSEDKTITAVSDSITQSFTAPANTKTIKAFVWENTMKPLDMLKAEK